jgi:hypothetical protein
VPLANKSPANREVDEAKENKRQRLIDAKRVRPDSIIARDHIARFCMACICLMARRAAFSPRFAAAKCGDLLFVVWLLRKRQKIKGRTGAIRPRDSARALSAACLRIADNLKPAGD